MTARDPADGEPQKQLDGSLVPERRPANMRLESSAARVTWRWRNWRTRRQGWCRACHEMGFGGWRDASTWTPGARGTWEESS